MEIVLLLSKGPNCLIPEDESRLQNPICIKITQDLDCLLQARTQVRPYHMSMCQL